MLTVNINLSDRIVNGQFGTTDNIVFTKSGISKIYLKFDELLVGKQLIFGDFYSSTHQVVPVNRVESQFSLMLAYACTIHKVQGLTIPNTVLVFDLKKQKSFNYGQLYVALSRANSLLGLTIVGNLKNKFVKVHPM